VRSAIAEWPLSLKLVLLSRLFRAIFKLKGNSKFGANLWKSFLNKFFTFFAFFTFYENESKWLAARIRLFSFPLVEGLGGQQELKRPSGAGD